MPHIRQLLATSLLALALVGCSDPGDSARAVEPIPNLSTVTPASLVEIGRITKGFEIGNPLSIRKVYVFFDPQCPHCGRLWGQMEALKDQAKFVWIPVSLLNRASASQGAALLTADSPVTLMDQHEKLLTGGRGGITGMKDIPSEVSDAIKRNTQVLRQLGGEGVPFLVGVNASDNSVVRMPGAIDARHVAQTFGWHF